MYNEVLRGLRPDSEKSDCLTRDLVRNANISIKQKIKIFTFQEGKGISTLAAFDGKVSFLR